MDELQDATPTEQRQLDALRALLRDFAVDEGRPAPDRISIYCYRDAYGAPRISEISFRYGSGGAAYMASDLDAFPVIYAAEVYLRDALEPVETHDPEQEARRGLLYWLDPDNDVNALPAWEERTTNPLADSDTERDAAEEARQTETRD